MCTPEQLLMCQLAQFLFTYTFNALQVIFRVLRLNNDMYKGEKKSSPVPGQSLFFRSFVSILVYNFFLFDSDIAGQL